MSFKLYVIGVAVVIGAWLISSFIFAYLKYKREIKDKKTGEQ